MRRELNTVPAWARHPFQDSPGPLARFKGSQTTTITPSPKSQTQLDIEQRQLALLDLNIQELQRQNEALAEVFPEQKALLALQIQSTTALLSQLEETPLQREIRETAEANTLAFLKGEAPPISAGRAALIEQQFGAAEQQVSTDLERFAGELAASRGLTHAALKAVDRKVERLKLALQEVARPHSGRPLALGA